MLRLTRLTGLVIKSGPLCLFKAFFFLFFFNHVNSCGCMQSADFGIGFLSTTRMRNISIGGVTVAVRARHLRGDRNLRNNAQFKRSNQTRAASSHLLVAHPTIREERVNPSTVSGQIFRGRGRMWESL